MSINHSDLSTKELREKLNNPPDTPDFKHALAELQVRREISQIRLSRFLVLFTGVIAFAGVVQLALVWKCLQ